MSIYNDKIKLQTKNWGTIMKKELLEKLQKLIFADSFKKGKSWGDYNVYIPVFKNRSDVGFPFVVLEKDGELRRSSQKESFEYLDYLNKN